MWAYLVPFSWAVDIPTETGNEVGVGCVARVQMKYPTLVLDTQQYPLKDDGVVPDQAATDGFYSVFVPTTSQKKAEAVLLGDDKQILWSGDLPYPPKGQQTWLLIDEVQEGKRPLVQVKFSPIPSSSERNTSKTSWWLYWFFIGLGMILGWSGRRTTPPKMKRLTSNDSTEPPRTRVADDEKELVDIVERYSRGMLVLLCTSKERQSLYLEIAEKNPVFVMNETHCEKHSLLEQLSILERFGDSILILDGMYGLAEPLAAESSASVVHEILQVSSHRICAIFLRSQIPDGIDVSSEPNENRTE